MKIVSWNCQGAFRTKASKIAAYQPDIAIIQECEHEEKLYKGANFPKPHSPIQCFGELADGGLCVMSYTGLEFEIDESYKQDIEYCIPLRVKGLNFNLIAVWTQNHADKNISYIGQVHRAIQQYESFIKSADTVLIGDFNSNQKFDKNRDIVNHSTVVNDLNGMGIVSLYHEWNNVEHGSELQKTYFANRKYESTHHIDYCFAPKSWLSRLNYFEIADYSNWKCHSDHSPIFIELNLERG